MTRRIELKDALASWPPFNAAAFGESPTVEPEDIITKARLRSNGHLVLHLKRDVQTFVSSVPVKEGCEDLLARQLQNVISKTVGEAGSIPLGVA
jgi:hypothetical protein